MKSLPSCAISVLMLALFLVQCKRTEMAPIPLPVSTAPTRDDNLALGNPSNAGKDNADNFLIDKGTYVVGYSASRGTANWVSWHLSQAWLGSYKRASSPHSHQNRNYRLARIRLESKIMKKVDLIEAICAHQQIEITLKWRIKAHSICLT